MKKLNITYTLFTNNNISQKSSRGWAMIDETTNKFSLSTLVSENDQKSGSFSCKGCQTYHSAAS